MIDCIFCKIANGDIATEFVKETDEFVVFRDKFPSAPVHLLIVPKKHYEDLLSAPDGIFDKVKKIASEIVEKEKYSGFRLAVNVGDLAEIKHLHFHFATGFKKSRKI